MTSAGPWGAIPQAEEFFEAAETIAEHAVEKVQEHVPEVVHEKPSDSNEHSGSSFATDTSSDIEKAASGHEVTKLARQLTQRSIKTLGGSYSNPFAGEIEDPALDPKSGHFKPETWVRTLIGLQSRDPERYPQRTAGVAYKNLSVHGFGSLADYQKYVWSLRACRVQWAD